MLIETLQWLRYPMNIIHILQSWRNWAVKLLDWTAVLRSTIEIPIRVLINGVSSFSTYHPNIICNSRRQICIKQIFCSLSKLCTQSSLFLVFGRILAGMVVSLKHHCTATVVWPWPSPLILGEELERGDNGCGEIADEEAHLLVALQAGQGRRRVLALWGSNRPADFQLQVCFRVFAAYMVLRILLV